jgi:hypothetical protein
MIPRPPARGAGFPSAVARPEQYPLRPTTGKTRKTEARREGSAPIAEPEHELCRAVLAIYTRALLGFYRKRAKGSGHDEGRTGTVTVIQRFGGALNLNIHFHTLAVDGVFVREPDGSLSFAAAKTPTDDEVEALLRVIRTRVLLLLVRRGLLCEEGGEALDETEPPPLHALYAASVRQRVAIGRRAGAAVSRSMCCSAPTAAAACVSSRPSCSRSP